MKYLKYFLVFLVFTFTFAGLIQSVDARGADEPCSYLNPTKYVRDSGGNCVLASSGSAAGVVSKQECHKQVFLRQEVLQSLVLILVQQNMFGIQAVVASLLHTSQYRK